MGKLSVNNTMGEFENLPELGEISKYVMYTAQKDEMANQFSAMPIAAVKEIGWSPEGMIRGMNHLIQQVEQGAKIHYVYRKEECTDDPQKEDVNIVRLVPERIDPEKPYIVLVSGGAYMTVCNGTESYPTAVHMVERGYQVFVFTYRVGYPGALPKALDDLNAAFSYIKSHAKEFQLNPDLYAISGFSAGANLISTWGTTNAGYKAYGKAKPVAMFPVYTVVDLKPLLDSDKNHAFLNSMLGEDFSEKDVEKYNIEQHINQDYPNCYIVCGKDDSTVSCTNSELLKQRLDEYGVASILEEAEHAEHGFGDGTGTEVEGWPERALDFMESLI